MSEFEDYSKELLEASKQFLQTANSSDSGSRKFLAYLRGSLFHAFCFLEAQINYICNHFYDSSVFGTLEKSLLLERDVELKNGEWKLSERKKFFGLEQRVEFLISAFSKDRDKSKGSWFSNLKDAIALRNKLVHPRIAHKLKPREVERAITAILDCVQELYLCVFDKPYPLAQLGLVARS